MDVWLPLPPFMSIFCSEQEKILKITMIITIMILITMICSIIVMISNIMSIISTIMIMISTIMNMITSPFLKCGQWEFLQLFWRLNKHWEGTKCPWKYIKIDDIWTLIMSNYYHKYGQNRHKEKTWCPKKFFFWRIWYLSASIFLVHCIWLKYYNYITYHL